MAIKISGTEVISDTRALTNITSITASGALTSNIHYITPIDGTNEGGELQIQGAAGWDSWIIDSFQNILRLRTNSPNTSLVFLNNSGAGTTDLSVEGRVGVGTTAPAAPLDIASSSTLDAFHVTNGNTYFTVGVTAGLGTDINSFQPGVGGRRLYIQSTGASTVFGGNVGIGTTAPTHTLTVGASGTPGNVAIARSGLETSAIYFTRVGNIDAEVTYNSDENLIIQNNFAGQHLILGTNASEKVRIANSGNVGIGHTAPLAPLDIRATIPGIRLTGSDNTLYGNFYASAAGIGLSSVQAQPLLFLASNQERMRINSDGSVGIGGAGSAAYNLLLQRNMTGATTTYGISSQGIIQADSTTSARLVQTIASTAVGASPYTISTLYHFIAEQAVLSANSSITTQHGYFSAASLISANTNIGYFAADTAAIATGKSAFGFYSNINSATGGGTAWGFYSGGTAPNYFAGQVLLQNGTTSFPSLSEEGDRDTGIYFPAANTVGIVTGGSEKFRVDTNGDAIVTGPGLLGYGTGSGGTVTQATSKTTGVTLNKTNGRITMSNAALAGGGSVSFTVTNSTVAATDVILLTSVTGTGGANYRIEPVFSAAGSFNIRVTNISAGSLSDALGINFAVLSASLS